MPANFNFDDHLHSAGLTVMETRQSLVDFIYSLEARGISLVLRRNRLNAGAQQPLLTAAERAYINVNRFALKELLQDPAAPIAAKPTESSQRTLSETHTFSEAAVAPDPARARAARDAYLKEHDPETWGLLHFNDPDEIARRNEEATAAMTSPYRPPIW